MGLLALLHRLGVNTALVAGLVMMPAVIAVGYWTNDHDRGGLAGLVLRGSISADTAPSIVPRPAGSDDRAAFARGHR